MLALLIDDDVVVTQLLNHIWLCEPMDGSPPGSSVRGIFQARILEWVAMPFSSGSSWPRDQTWVSRISGRQILYHLSVYLCAIFQKIVKKKKKTELQRSQGKNINLHHVIDFNCLAIKYEGNFKNISWCWRKWELSYFNF